MCSLELCLSDPIIQPLPPQPVEPIVYVPILPPVLVNGAEGIGTGWSTYVPQHHPRAVIDACARALEEYERAGAAGWGARAAEDFGAAPAPADPALALPWWRGFTGGVLPAPAAGGVLTSGRALWTHAITGSGGRGGEAPPPAARGRRGGPPAAPASRPRAPPRSNRFASGDTDASDGGESDSESEEVEDGEAARWLAGGSSSGEGGAGGATHVRIEELPIGRWTEDYKAQLQALLAGGLLRSVREYHSEARVDFLLALTPEGCAAVREATLALAGRRPAGGARARGGAGAPPAAAAAGAAGGRELAAAGLAAFFKLQAPVSSRNMHLFDARGSIRRFGGPTEVVRAHTPLRYALYAARKLRAEAVAAAELARESARARFLGEVVSGRLAVGRVERAAIERELWARGFPAFLGAPAPAPASASASDAPGAAAREALPPALRPAAHLLDLRALEPSRSLTCAQAPSPPPRAFDYLLGMPIYQLSAGSLTEAERRVVAAGEALRAARASEPGEAWRADLGHLAHAIEADAVFARR